MLDCSVPYSPPDPIESEFSSSWIWTASARSQCSPPDPKSKLIFHWTSTATARLQDSPPDPKTKHRIKVFLAAAGPQLQVPLKRCGTARVQKPQKQLLRANKHRSEGFKSLLRNHTDKNKEICLLSKVCYSCTKDWLLDCLTCTPWEWKSIVETRFRVFKQFRDKCKPACFKCFFG